MKKLIFVILLFITASCYQEGKIYSQSTNIFRINGKNYKFFSVAPAENYTPVWILVPLDSSVAMPISMQYQAGKHTQSVIIIN